MASLETMNLCLLKVPYYRQLVVKGSTCSSILKMRIGENKNKANVDDILGIWQAVDEGGLVDQLPTYCSAVITRIPVIEDELSDSFHENDYFRPTRPG